MNNSTNQANMLQGYNGGYRYNLDSTRLWIKIANILGAIMSIIGIGIYYYYAFDINKSASTSDNILVKSFQINLNKIPSIIIMVFANFLFMSSIIFSIALVHFVSTASDDDLIANKWTLAALSLTASGFLTPFLLTRLPNVEVKATRNARATISKWFGLAGLMASVMSGIIIGVYWLNNKPDAESLKMNTILIASLAAISAFTLISCLVFFRKDTDEKMANNEGIGQFAKALSIMYTIVATILLILQLIYMVLKIVSIFSEMFSSEGNAFARFLNIIGSGFQIAMTIWTMTIIIQVIGGIWKKDGKPEFKFNENAQKHLQPNA